MKLFCAIIGHLRDRQHAWHDGLEWRSSCVRCGTPMIRDELRAHWRPFEEDDESDMRTERVPRS